MGNSRAEATQLHGDVLLLCYGWPASAHLCFYGEKNGVLEQKRFSVNFLACATPKISDGVYANAVLPIPSGSWHEPMLSRVSRLNVIPRFTCLLRRVTLRPAGSGPHRVETPPLFSSPCWMHVRCHLVLQPKMKCFLLKTFFAGDLCLFKKKKKKV